VNAQPFGSWHQRGNAVLGAVETIRESVDRLNRIAAYKLADQLNANSLSGYTAGNLCRAAR
jgi:hypothetical protein